MLDEAALSLRAPFVAWVDALHARHGSDRRWWFTQVAEHNSLVSPLFLYSCYLVVARRCLDLRRPPAVIVAESWGVVDALSALFRSRGLPVLVVGAWRSQLSRGWDVLRVVARLGQFVVRSIGLQRAARKTRDMRQRPGGPRPAPRALVVTYFHEGSMAEDGVFRDRYLPALHEYLAARGMEVWVLATLADRHGTAAAKYRWMNGSRTRFLVPEDWLRLSDYVRATVDSLYGWWRPSGPAVLLDLDIGPLLAEERRRQVAANAVREAGLLFRLPARLREAGFVPERVIAWSENQMRDKALVMGCRASFPGVVLSGVQNSPLYGNVLSMFPTARECDAGVIADRVVCSGPLPASILERASGGHLSTRVGCALRYAYLWQRSGAEVPPARADGSRDVLVALPVTPGAAALLLDLLLPLCRMRPAWRWHFKPHPDYTLDDLKPALGPDAERLPGRVVSGSLGDWLAKVDVVIASGSGTVLECVAFGTPVILVGGLQTFSLDPMEWFNGAFVPICYSATEVIRELDRVGCGVGAERDEAQRRRIEVLEAWFAPVSEEALRRFVED